MKYIQVRNKFRRILSGMLSLSLAIGMAACAGGGQHSSDTQDSGKDSPAAQDKANPDTADNQDQSGTTAQKEKISVVLDWYPNAVHSFLYVAMDKGYYAEEGLDLEILFPANPNDSLTLPAAGKADLGIFYQQDIIETAVNQSIPLQTVGCIVHQPLSVVLSLQEKQIKSPADLAGKTVGYSSNVLSEAIIRNLLRVNNVDADQVQFIDVGFDLMSAMTSGRCDATLGALVNHEVPVMEKEGFKVNYFFPYEFGLPKYYEMLFVSSESRIREQGDKLARFLRASKRGFEDSKADPDAAVDTLLKHQNAENFPLDREVERKSLQILLPMMDSAGEPFLSQKAEIWQKNLDWEKAMGIIPSDADAAPERFIVDLA